MQRTCAGCGRMWQLETPHAPLSRLRCPYDDCRCSFILRVVGAGLSVERARAFYRERSRSLRAEFDAGSTESRSDDALLAALLTALLSLLGLGYWLGLGWAFFWSLSLAPLVLLLHLERALPALAWLYLAAALLVASALTPSPLALAAMLPELAASGLASLGVVAISGVIGFLFYGGLRYRHASSYAQRALRQEKARLPRVEASRRAGAPYR